MGITNPLADHNREELIMNGPGGGAMNTERMKREKYKDLDWNKYSFTPFIIETGGAMGKSALSLCTKLRKIMETKCCSGRENIGYVSSSQSEAGDPIHITGHIAHLT